MSLYEYYFTGRKPSNKQVLAKINEGISQGHDYMEISWGENMIMLDKPLVNGKREIWYGSGWIKGISGYDIAADLNENKTRQTMREHFELLNVWNT